MTNQYILFYLCEECRLYSNPYDYAMYEKCPFCMEYTQIAISRAKMTTTRSTAHIEHEENIINSCYLRIRSLLRLHYGMIHYKPHTNPPKEIENQHWSPVLSRAHKAQV